MYHSLNPPENCSGLIILTKPLEISAAWMNRKDKHLSNCSGCALTTYIWVNQCHFNAYFDWNTGDILKCYAEFEMFYLIQQNVILATDLWMSLVQAWNRERESPWNAAAESTVSVGHLQRASPLLHFNLQWNLLPSLIIATKFQVVTLEFFVMNPILSDLPIII